MNEAALPDALRLPRSTANSLTTTTAIHHPLHTHTTRRPDLAPATIPASAISVHRIDSETWKAVESNISMASHLTSSQWCTVRASSTVAKAVPAAAAGRAQSERLPPTGV